MDATGGRRCACRPASSCCRWSHTYRHSEEVNTCCWFDSFPLEKYWLSVFKCLYVITENITAKPSVATEMCWYSCENALKSGSSQQISPNFENLLLLSICVEFLWVMSWLGADTWSQSLVFSSWNEVVVDVNVWTCLLGFMNSLQHLLYCTSLSDLAFVWFAEGDLWRLHSSNPVLICSSSSYCVYLLHFLQLCGLLTHWNLFFFAFVPLSSWVCFLQSSI